MDRKVEGVYDNERIARHAVLSRQNKDDQQRNDDAREKAAEGEPDTPELEGHDDAGDDGKDQAERHECDEDFKKERDGLPASAFVTAERVNRGEGLEDFIIVIQTKGLPDAGDGKEEQHRREERAEVEMDLAELFHVLRFLNLLPPHSRHFISQVQRGSEGKAEATSRRAAGALRRGFRVGLFPLPRTSHDEESRRHRLDRSPHLRYTFPS